jgi:hypothetical protein
MEALFQEEEPTMNTANTATAGSTLRQRLIDDMILRRFGAKTHRDYIRSVSLFAAFLGRSPATATAEHRSRLNGRWTDRHISEFIRWEDKLSPITHEPEVRLGTRSR